MTGRGWTITLDKSGATWYYFTKNPQGGGGGSNNCGPKKSALHRAMLGIPPGEPVTIITKHNGRMISSEASKRKRLRAYR